VYVLFVKEIATADKICKKSDNFVFSVFTILPIVEGQFCHPLSVLKNAHMKFHYIPSRSSIIILALGYFFSDV